MPQTLILNPSSRRRNPSAKQIAARRRFAAMARSGAFRRTNPKRRRRHNPTGGGRRRVANPRNTSRTIVVMSPRRTPRRLPSAIPAMVANPRRRRHRRRNPLGLNLGSTSTYVDMIKGGFIGGAGAVLVDLGMGYVNRWLPSTLQRTPGEVGVGDAVKMIITIAAGKLLQRPTKGLSIKMAQGALAVQSHAIIANMLPAGMTLGYAVPSVVASGTPYVGPVRGIRPGLTRGNLRRYIPGPAPVLSGAQMGMYVPGAAPMLSRRP